MDTKSEFEVLPPGRIYDVELRTLRIAHERGWDRRNQPVHAAEQSANRRTIPCDSRTFLESGSR